MPLITEIISRPKGTWYAIQQPEIHLHPKAQAALGDLIFYAAEKDNKKFIIETHSDYIIDRYRFNYRKKLNIKTQSQIVFFQKLASKNTLSHIAINQNGSYSQKQPKAFRDFFIKEQLSLLNL